jgi:hypothetical protein
MTKMRRLCLIVIVLLHGIAARASLASVYIAQNAQGGNTGADCANALAVSFFNTSSNWGSGGSQIGPGTTAHLCGTFTGTAGSTMLTAQGSGSSGNPVVVLFEPNAIFQAPYWGDDPFSFTKAAIVCNGHSWITIDGGTNGIIQNTANGTNLANHHGTAGVIFQSCNNFEVKNLTIKEMYVHVQDDGVRSGGVVDLFTQDSDFGNIHDSTFTDAYQNVNLGYSTSHSITSMTFGPNNIVDYGCHLIQVGDSNDNSTASGMNIFGNTWGPHQTIWTEVGGACHEDGIFVNAANTNSILSNSSIYNNLIQSDMCNASPPDSNFNCSGLLYLAGAFNNVNVFNNVAIVIAPHSGYEGILLMRPISNGALSNISIYNNTIIGNNSDQACDCAGLKLNGLNSGFLIKNNIWTQLSPAYLQNESGTNFRNIFGASGNVDYNDYFGVSKIGADSGSQAYTTLSSWQSPHSTNSFPGYDLDGSAGDPKLATNYEPQPGSAAIGLGTNLTGLGIAALNSDKGGISRPSSGNWDAGAYQDPSGNPPAPPTGLAALVK